ncbi:MAG: RICIN domain-containing protein [Micromonosporaceae bacterium]
MKRRIVRLLAALSLIAATAVGIGVSATASHAGTGWSPTTLSVSGYCLDADRNTWYGNGSKVQMWGCNGWSNQQWWANWPTGNGETTYTTIRTPGGSAGPSKCLDGDLNARWRVQTWDCNGWDNQLWAIHKWCGPEYCVFEIRNVAFGSFLRPPDRLCNGCLPYLGSQYTWYRG